MNERRESTAAKIIIGREDIERYGDSTTTEVLKRLPGVTVGGAPGRGGPPRMRGMGAGFTQILLNGERLPPGFSLDSITPEQIERIEVLRAPTAETGARAIAGTINIITREGFTKRVNDLKVGTTIEDGRLTPGLFFTRNDSIGPGFIYTAALALFRPNQVRRSSATTVLEDLDTGAVLTRDEDTSTNITHSKGINLNARLQFRFGEGHGLVLMPMVIATRPTIVQDGTRDRTLCTPPAGQTECTPMYAFSDGGTTGRFSMGRLNAQYNRMFADGWRADLRAGGAVNRWSGVTTRQEYDPNGVLLTDSLFDVSTRDQNTTLSGKLTKLFAENHNVVAGIETEGNTRRETRITTVNGVVPDVLEDFGENLEASVKRLAVYIQDEWNITPQWAAHAGIRWEGIDTEGSGAGGSVLRNKSSVTTPLLHAVYKLDAKKRDQVRVSLTRSYRTPTLPQLIARPNIALNNSPTSVDRYGNPDLKPELATGVDMAFERFLDQGGVLSANLFHRRLSDVIRNVISTNATTGRFESRPENFGGARTTGLELEAKFRLDQWLEGTPAVDLRFNASVYDSKVDAVQGPNNRLEAQARGAFNMGVDYRFRGTPVAVGGNVNWTPSATTKLTEQQTLHESAKLVGDAYATWTFNPNTVLRLGASNFVPRDFDTTTRVTFANQQQTRLNRDHTDANFSIRLELKL